MSLRSFKTGKSGALSPLAETREESGPSLLPDRRGTNGLPPIKSALKTPSESGRSDGGASFQTGKTGGSQRTGKTGKTGRTKKSRKPSSRGSASDIASQIRSMTRQTMSQDGSESWAGSDSTRHGHDKEERKRVRNEVMAIYEAVLGRKVDAAGLSHYCACLLDGEIKPRHLIQQLCRSTEFVSKQEEELSRVTMVRREWLNRFHPWNAEPDEADEEVGTVRWVYNDAKANAARWETGENEGGSLGAEVINGTLFNSTKDHWTSVVVASPLDKPGVHVWRLKKILAGQSGALARVGVLVRDCELDMDYQRPHFSDRAFFMDESGNVWNGNAFLAFGADWSQRHSVVTLRLDTMKRCLSLHVTKVDSSQWADLLDRGDVDEGPLVARIAGLPDTALFPFAQDLYAGSGFQLSKFVSTQPDEEGEKMVKHILGREEALIDDMCEKEVDVEAKKAQRKLSMAGTSVGSGSVSGASTSFGRSSVPGSSAASAYGRSAAALSRAGSMGGKSLKSVATAVKSVASRRF